MSPQLAAVPDIASDTSYDELVRRGREAREHADGFQWVEGDLALEVEALHPTERPRDPSTGAFLADEAKALKRYAADIDLNYSTLRHYRTAAAAWPRGRRRPGASWGTHAALNALPDRFQLISDGMTVSDASKIVRDRNGRANTGGKPGWHELLGRVGDAIADAEKHMAKVDAEVDREPSADFMDKAREYATWADRLAVSLRDICEWEAA